MRKLLAYLVKRSRSQLCEQRRELPTLATVRVKAAHLGSFTLEDQAPCTTRDNL
jgi:hypothetical protein